MVVTHFEALKQKFESYAIYYAIYISEKIIVVIKQHELDAFPPV